MDSESHNRAGLRWPALALLFLLPLVLGLSFQTDGSGNGDGAAYRTGVCYIETEGRIPLARVEWSHPGHLLVSWGATRLLAALGWAQDPHYAIHLVNFLALGILALVLARTWFLHDPDRGRSFLAGLCVALLPGWAWCAQEPLSDVSGHSLVALSVCGLLALQIRIRDHRPHLMLAFLAAFLAGAAFLFRPSAGLFLPLFLWLGVGALIQARTSRVRLTIAFLLGGLLPILAIYTHLFFLYGLHGPHGLLAVHLPAATHNLVFRGFPSILGLVKDWFHHSHHGLGLYAFLLACTGWLIWLMHGDWRPAVPDADSNKKKTRRWTIRPFFLFTLGLLPYFIFLLGNAAAGRFRFSLPVQLSLALGVVPLLGHLQKLRPGPWLAPYVSVFAAATLFHSLTLLSLLASRHHFIEAGAREISKLSLPTDLLLGHQSAPYLKLREQNRELLSGGWGKELAHATGARTQGIRFDSKEDDFDFWNWSWRRAEKEILQTQAMGGRVLYINEMPLGGFREWLALRGFGEESMASLPAESLRNRMDTSLERMSKTMARQLIDLQVLRVEGPGARLESGLTDSPNAITAKAIGYPAHDYRLLVGIYSETESAGYLGIPVPMETLTSKPTILDTGRLDERGYSSLDIAPSARPQGEVWLLLVMNKSGTKIVARSQLFFPHPADDQTPADSKLWTPPVEEMQIR